MNDKKMEAVATALRNLVKVNEDHNAACEEVMGRPLGWKDDYLTAAREALDAYAKASKGSTVTEVLKRFEGLARKWLDSSGHDKHQDRRAAKLQNAADLTLLINTIRKEI